MTHVLEIYKFYNELVELIIKLPETSDDNTYHKNSVSRNTGMKHRYCVISQSINQGQMSSFLSTVIHNMHDNDWGGKSIYMNVWVTYCLWQLNDKKVGDNLSQKCYSSRDSKESYACNLPQGLVMKGGCKISMFNDNGCFGHMMMLEMM